MKKAALSICIFLCIQSLFAGVLTVSNDPNKPAQYTSPTTALSNAAAGDTLYIYGSPTGYGQFIINKNITIIGAGNNTTKESFHKTVFSDVYLQGATLNGVTIDGIYTNNFYLSPSLVNYSNITIRNTIIYLTFSGAAGSPLSCGSVFTNWLIENCIIGNFINPINVDCNPVAPVSNGYLIKNSSFRAVLNSRNVVYQNCQIGIETGGNTFGGQTDCTYNNCIFYGMSFTQNTFNQNNVFNHCLTFAISQPSQNFNLNSWTGGASGTANNCIINQNPLWLSGAPPVNFPSSVSNGSKIFWDPAIQVSSPAKNAGADGKDIGLTGGNVPYNVFAEPKIPMVRKYQLVNPVVPPSGTVTVNATATKAQ